jgi:hypothetical protein
MGPPATDHRLSTSYGLLASALTAGAATAANTKLTREAFVVS